MAQDRGQRSQGNFLMAECGIQTLANVQMPLVFPFPCSNGRWTSIPTGRGCPCKASIRPEVLQWHNAEHVAHCSIHVLRSAPSCTWLKNLGSGLIASWVTLSGGLTGYTAKRNNLNSFRGLSPSQLDLRPSPNPPCCGASCCQNLQPFYTMTRPPRCKRWSL